MSHAERIRVLIGETGLRDVRNLASTGCEEACAAHWTQTLGLATLRNECKA